MAKFLRHIAILLVAISICSRSHAQEKHAEEKQRPIALHPQNPHYFLFRGEPTFLITSAEHYGAVLNAEFDYVKYLDELAAHGLNNTRTWSGSYCEDAKAFNIAKNT